MTTIQDVIDRGRKYEKENVVLREEISLKDTQIKDLTQQSQKKIDSLMAEVNALKKELEQKH